MNVHRVISLITVIFSALAIVTTSLGAHIYRWEMIALAASVILWVAVAWVYEMLADL